MSQFVFDQGQGGVWRCSPNIGAVGTMAVP